MTVHHSNGRLNSMTIASAIKSYSLHHIKVTLHPRMNFQTFHQDKLDKLEKRSKDRILLKIFGDIRKKQNLSSCLVTRGMDSMNREPAKLQRYNPDQEGQDKPQTEEVQISKIDWNFFRNPQSYVVSYFVLKVFSP